MSRALESISILASDICEDIGDSTERHHLRIQKKILEGYQKLYWYVLPDFENIQSEILPYNGTVQYELPCNFVYETKVGMLYKGCYITLDLKKGLRLQQNTMSDTQAGQCINGFADGSIAPDSWLPFYNVWRNGAYLGEIYSMGCGFHSHQWYDIQDGVLSVGNMVPDGAEILVEYKSNGIPKTGLKLVPAESAPYCKFFAKARLQDDVSPAKAAYFDDLANKQYYRLKKLYSYRSPEYLGWLFKSFDKAGRY